jgi:hypothetical protein
MQGCGVHVVVAMILFNGLLCDLFGLSKQKIHILRVATLLD